MWKHINISNELLLEKIDILKSKYNIFQTTKLLEYLVNKEFDTEKENKTDSKKEEVFPWLEDSVWISNNDIKEEKQELNSYWRPVYKSQPKIVDDDDPSSIFA